MVSAEVSCDLCLKEALKSTERAIIYSNAYTAEGISYKLTDLGNKLDSIGSDVVGIQLPSTIRLVCKSCKGLIERTHQLYVDLRRNREILRGRLDARDRELRGLASSCKQGSTSAFFPCRILMHASSCWGFGLHATILSLATTRFLSATPGGTFLRASTTATVNMDRFDALLRLSSRPRAIGARIRG